MTVTAVLPELTEKGAETLTQRISGRLDAIADNYVAVMPLIREAIARSAHLALGYPSSGAYAKDRFADALSKLEPSLRREVVREFSAAGMSTRAIAPVVGVSHMTVKNDLDAGVKGFTPGPINVTPDLAPRDTDWSADEPEETPARHLHAVNNATGEVIDLPVTTTETHTVKTVVGLDGKEYKQPPRTPKPILAGDALEIRDAQENAKSVGAALGTLEGFTFAAHRERVRDVWWPKGADAVTPHDRDLYVPQTIRDIAAALAKFADELEASK